MPVRWTDVTDLSFNALLLLEPAQLEWLPGWVNDSDMGLALAANPAVAWYLRHAARSPRVREWLDRITPPAEQAEAAGPDEVRAAEMRVLQTLNDLVTYALNPEVYDQQPFLGWDSRELTSLVDFAGKTVIDVGAGTGRLALVAAEQGAAAVFPVDPVGRLRAYLKEKARAAGYRNVYPVDGLITDLPFPDAFADVTMSGHVYGDDPEEELAEMLRVTRPGGIVILCPGNNDVDDAVHDYLVSQGMQWSRFEEPDDGWKRKYWRVVD
jgi:SAM-dependent methyltransferase